MSTATLVFPHQLFRQHPSIDAAQPIYLVEEWLFFRQYRFHKMKLLLHRASMQFYHDWLLQQQYMVHYIDSTDPRNDVRVLLQTMAAAGIKQVCMADPADDWLLRRIQKACDTCHIRLILHASPAFLTDLAEADTFFVNRKNYFQTDFYIQQRKKYKLLLDEKAKPLGGKWSFDAENRQVYPKKQKPPEWYQPAITSYITEAKQYVNRYFPENYGSTDGPLLFAIDFTETGKWLNDFIRHRLQEFGAYEDAIVAAEPVLHHSVLSPMLNTGLITPREVIYAVIKAGNKQHTPLNSLEGFIRQVTGWREFIRIVYMREGRKQRTTNYWQFKRKIPRSFWEGTTGILPIDLTIQKILKTGYCHHIERLMVLGNFMLLCEFDPDEVYRWFMELFIDAYDWVMVPNVYGMTQFADGGLMTTKPYISGSNYLMKMSDYPKGNWQAVWDGLFWRFMHVHRNFFLQNPRLGMLIGTFDKMPQEKQEQHLLHANNWLQQLDNA